MTATDKMQQSITKQVAKGTITPRPFNSYQVEVEWYLGDVPLCIPDEVCGEWRLVRARCQNTLWKVTYSYYRPTTMYCVMLHLEEGQVEVPGTRTDIEHTALATARGLNAAVPETKKDWWQSFFQVHKLENSDE